MSHPNLFLYRALNFKKLDLTSYEMRLRELIPDYRPSNDQPDSAEERDEERDLENYEDWLETILSCPLQGSDQHPEEQSQALPGGSGVQSGKQRYSFYQCSVCGKVIHGKSQHDVHVRTHTDEKPYQYQVFEKRFHARSNLRKHETLPLSILPSSVCLVWSPSWLLDIKFWMKSIVRAITSLYL